MKKILILAFLAGLFCVAGTAMADGTAGLIDNTGKLIKYSIKTNDGTEKIYWLGPGHPNNTTIDFDGEALHVNYAWYWMGLFPIPNSKNVDIDDGWSLTVCTTTDTAYLVHKLP